MASETATSQSLKAVDAGIDVINAQMTQCVPELSLAQTLFNALTKMLQTNIDSVLNLVR
jgi:hypothetical protein